ncbi:hypothetical protein C1645_739293 [Glomus cerebriforme]|uniref:Protein kinase domain-containing protein n=1 Tax=Glomus cerebriforme TaxID=658196 RepID=A0A397SUH6_9GLOM|nr:hypothetical protein C1645_739293 [Glomus cerebriforme]
MELQNYLKKYEYAMVLKHAENGDLRKYIRKCFSTQNSNDIQGVLPYIAPEVLRNNPYTKQSEVYSMGSDEKVEELLTEEECEKKFDTKTFITIAYTNKVLGKHKSKTTESDKKALAWLHVQVKDEKLEKEILESCVSKPETVKKDQPAVPKPVSDIPKEKEPEKPECSSTDVELDDVEEIIKLDNDVDDHEKADAFDTVKSSITKEIIQNVVSKQNEDGSIEASKDICTQLNVSSEETTAVKIAYLKNLAD